jgi:hypothetical protein
VSVRSSTSSLNESCLTSRRSSISTAPTAASICTTSPIQADFCDLFDAPGSLEPALNFFEEGFSASENAAGDVGNTFSFDSIMDMTKMDGANDFDLCQPQDQYSQDHLEDLIAVDEIFDFSLQSAAMPEHL